MRPWRQESLYLAICFAAATAIAFLPPSAQARFSGYGAGAPPLLMLAVATVAGTAAIWSLRRGGFFTPARGRSGLAAALRLAAALALPVILLDLASPFPRGTNVPWPEAWLFYPAIAVVAEAAMHLAPLALVFLLVRRALPAIVLAALAEPAFQTALNAGLPDWQRMLVAAQVFLVGLVGLHLFRRHGIAALVAFRIAYYLIWHILWGEARLWVLFGGP